MGAYGFKKQFVPFILNGSKTHTIRGKRKHPDKPSAIFHGFYAMRTKQCQKLIEAPVLRVQDFRMERCRVWIDGDELDDHEKNSLAWCDVFRFANGSGDIRLTGAGGCFRMMLDFWIANHGTTDFIGDLIHWDYQKRVMLAEDIHV